MKSSIINLVVKLIACLRGNSTIWYDFEGHGTFAEVGGIVGYGINSNIEKCYTQGMVIAQGGVDFYGYAAGIICTADSSIMKNCFNSATINAQGINASMAGIVNSADSTEISYCYNNGTIGEMASATHSAVGIAIGASNSTIKECYNIGKIGDAYESSDQIWPNNGMSAGIVLGIQTNTTITNCFSAVGDEIQLAGQYAGGYRLPDRQQSHHYRLGLWYG